MELPEYSIQAVHLYIRCECCELYVYISRTSVEICFYCWMSFLYDGIQIVGRCDVHSLNAHGELQ